jgi:hypothetical protein
MVEITRTRRVFSLKRAGFMAVWAEVGSVRVWFAMPAMENQPIPRDR